MQSRHPEGQFQPEGQEVFPDSPSENQVLAKTKRSRCIEYDKREVKEGQDAKSKRKPRSRKQKVSGQEMLEYMRKQDALSKILGAEAVFTPRTQTSLAHFFSPKNLQSNNSG